MEKIVKVLGDLTGSTGVLPSFLADAFIEEPKFFAAVVGQSDLTVEILDVLCDMCGFSVQDAIRVFGSYTPELLTTTGPDVTRRLEAIIDAGIQPGRLLGRVVRRCPGILFAADPSVMTDTIVNLNNFFARSHIVKILLRSPEVVLRNFDETEAKYEYIYYQMGIQPEEFVDCTFWSTASLQDIMDRHTFLLKTGKYTLPDPKRPQIKMENPPLYRILDSRDNIFATQVAKVTPDEWTLYRELSVKLTTLEDKDRPFERIKPSMRKAYERRLKEAPEKEAFVFE
uniref:Cilia- and flagella-associated protein 206 n=1 Tax=Panagrellus redivivus TaxID=6233 RepID=A0A7E4VTS1_PANRE